MNNLINNSLFFYLNPIIKILFLLIAFGYYLNISKEFKKEFKYFLFISIFIYSINLFDTSKQILERILYIVGSSFKLFIFMSVGNYFFTKNKLKENLVSNKKLDFKTIFFNIIPAVIWSLAIYSFFNIELNKEYIIYMETKEIVFLIINMIFIVPIVEEIYYRQYIINQCIEWLGNKKNTKILIIFISTFLFTISHERVYTNNLIKFIQIFPLGIALSRIYLKKGIKHSICAHSFYNIIIFISTLIIS